MHPDLAASGKWSIRRTGLVIGLLKGASEPCKNASASAGVISRLAEFATAADEAWAGEVVSVLTGCSAAEREVRRIAGAAVSGESARGVEFLAADGLVAVVIRIETIVPKLALIRISTNGFALKRRTRVEALLDTPSAFGRTLARRESLRWFVLSMGLLCRGSMVTLKGNSCRQPRVAIALMITDFCHIGWKTASQRERAFGGGKRVLNCTNTSSARKF